MGCRHRGCIAFLKELPVVDAVLPTRNLSDGVALALERRAPLPSVRLESPAQEAMTTMAELAGATIMPRETLEHAQERMAQQGVQVLLVVERMPQVLGVLALDDLQGEKPLRLLSERRIARRDLRVADLMQPVSALDAIELRALRRASVGQVVATLARSKRPHLLVVEPAPDAATLDVVGLLSKTQVERQLGTALPPIGVAGSFAEIEQALI
jgi:CBS domain-containing protein